MTRIAPSPARLRPTLRQAGASVALALALVAGAAAPTASAASETEYRFPFDPDTTTPVGGEFASEIANGKKRKNPHRGHDFSFADARGVEIPAIADGVVAASSTEGSLGNCVALEHPDGAFSAYCHMDEPTPLEVGQRVRMGDPVGRVGGSPQVPVHLHLTMGWTVGAMGGIGTFDPIPYIEARLAKPEPERKSEKPASETPKRAPGIALTQQIATAV